MIRTHSLLAGALIFAAAASPVLASVTIGAPGDSGNGNVVPFGGGSPQYQQIYAASDFTGPIDITGITFFNKNYTPGDVNSADYSFQLSTSTATVGNLSTNFSSNIGADNTTIFAGGLNGPIDTTTHEFTITGTHDFKYDPSTGNLLLNITNDGTTSNFTVFLDAINSSNSYFSRAFVFNSTTYSDGAGLVTRFNGNDTLPTPEPASFAAFGFGALGLFAMALKARKNRRVPQS